jgi:hypothetical protein
MLRNISVIAVFCVVCCFGVVAVSAAPVQWQASAGGNDHWYEVVMDNQSSWDQAEANAEQAGGYLATITSPGEQQFIESLLHDHASYSGLYWMGLKGTNIDGIFTWITTEPLSYTHWYPGEPNDYEYGIKDSRGGILWTTEADTNDPWYLGRRGWWDDQPALGFDTSPTGAIDLQREGYVVETIPEPSTLALLGVGAISLLGYAWRRS